MFSDWGLSHEHSSHEMVGVLSGGFKRSRLAGRAAIPQVAFLPPLSTPDDVPSRSSPSPSPCPVHLPVTGERALIPELFGLDIPWRGHRSWLRYRHRFFHAHRQCEHFLSVSKRAERMLCGRRCMTIMFSWERWRTISWLARGVQHLANAPRVSLGITPRCLSMPMVPWISSLQLLVRLATLVLPALRMFLLWRVLRNCLTSSPRNFLSSPSPSPSQAVSSPENHRTPPESSPTPEPTCRKATPVFNHIRKKWCCSVCNRDFRGRWECKRHIEATDRRARCLACGANLKARGDSLLRHFAKYCKGDVGNVRLEDAFVEV
jgi:hypothetical protein